MTLRIKLGTAQKASEFLVQYLHPFVHRVEIRRKHMFPPCEFIDEARGSRNRGIPDLAYIDDNRDVHLSEIKIGRADCRHMAEDQVRRYVDQANMDDQEMHDYKNSPHMRRQLRAMGLTGGGLGRFHLMDPSSIGYTVPNSVMVGSTEVHLGDCPNGVILYKNIGEQSEDRQLCDNNADDFVDGLMDRAEQMVDNYIDRQVDRLVTQAISNLSLEDMITLAYQHARPALRQLVVDNSGPEAWAAIELMGDERAVAALGAYLEHELGSTAINALRPVIQQAKTAVLNVIRQRMKAALRPFVEGIIRSLCNENAAVAAAMALQMIQQRIGELFQTTLNGVIQEAAIAAATAIAVAALVMMIILLIAIIVVIVIIVLALPENNCSFGYRWWSYRSS